VPAFDNGEALWQVVVDQQLEGVVAKRLADPYVPGDKRLWLKTKSPSVAADGSSNARRWRRRASGDVPTPDGRSGKHGGKHHPLAGDRTGRLREARNPVAATIRNQAQAPSPSLQAGVGGSSPSPPILRGRPSCGFALCQLRFGSAGAIVT
jgi:hypothetical protein